MYKEKISKTYLMKKYHNKKGIEKKISEEKM